MSRVAVGSITRAEIRSSWHTLVLIGLLAGFAASVTVGALTVSRRTATAYDRLGVATRVDDARGTSLSDELVDQLVTLPSVTDHWRGRSGIAQIGDTFSFIAIAAGPEPATSMLRPILLEGRLPRSAHGDVIEVVVRDDFQRETAVEVGTSHPVTFLTRDDFFRFDTGFDGGSPNGPELELEIVGVVRLPGTLDTMPPALAAPEVLRQHPDAFEPGAVWFTRLQGGASAVADFAEDVERLAADYDLPPEAAEFRVTDVIATDTSAAGVDNTAELLGRALLVVAAAVGAAALVAVGQAFARHHAGRRDQTAVESALGFTPSQRVLARIGVAALPAGLAAAITAIAGVWAGRIEPLGAIRNYEPDPGSAPNVGVVVGGATTTALVVAAIAAATSLVAIRRRDVRASRPSWLVTKVAAITRSAAGVTGLRFAFEPGRGVRAVPVRSAIVGAAIGIGGAVAGMVFVSSLDRLTSSSVRSGIPFDVFVSDVQADDLEALAANPSIASVVQVESAPVDLDGETVPAHGLQAPLGRLEIQVTEGRLPRTPDEVLLGLRAQRNLGTHVGDTVTARSPYGSSRELAVVGVGVAPPFNSESLGLNAILTPAGLDAVAVSEPFTSAAVIASAGVDPTALLEELGESFEVSSHPLPYEIDNLRQLGRLPALAAGAVGLIALLALANAVLMLVRRRRHDLATLRAVGFTSGQTRAAVLTMATGMAVAGLVVGVPVGLAAGGWLWHLTAHGAFVATDSVAPAALVASLAAGALVVAVGAAAFPAIRAGRISPATLLRAE